jgi:hypothetical protein
MASPVYFFDVNRALIVPDTADILAAVQAEYKGIFGEDLVTTPDTPQGALIVAESLARSYVAENNATIANQLNPNLAGGLFLDALLALTGSYRLPATYTVVSATLSGVPNTQVPKGSLAQETVGLNQFATQALAIIGTGGTVTVNMIAVNPGPITVAIGTLTQIISNTVLGWESVTNPAVQTAIGALRQSDGQAKVFRRQTLGAQGTSLPTAMIAGLHLTPGVTSLWFQENTSNASATINGVVMVPNSIYLCVNGGANLDVATTMANKKSGGCAYNNGASATPITQPVTQPYSGQIQNVLFDRPDIITIFVQITVIGTPNIPNPIQAVQTAIINYANFMLGVGKPVSAFELAGAVTQGVPGIFVTSLTMNKTGGTPSSTEIAISPWQIASIIANNVVVTVSS